MSVTSEFYLYDKSKNQSKVLALNNIISKKILYIQ